MLDSLKPRPDLEQRISKANDARGELIRSAPQELVEESAKLGRERLAIQTRKKELLDVIHANEDGIRHQQRRADRNGEDAQDAIAIHQRIIDQRRAELADLERQDHDLMLELHVIEQESIEA